MARSFEKVAPDRLQIREGGGGLSLFGVPFFGAGIFVILTVLGLVPVNNADTMSPFGWLLLALLGTAFTAVGGAMVFGRAWTTLDVTRRAIVKQWGLLVPLRERTIPLGEYTAVTLGFVRGDSDTADTFPVGLQARAGAELTLSRFTEFAKAREYAAAVARHLHLDLEDASTDHPIRLSPGHVDGPLQRRVWREPGPQNAASRPSQARSDVSRESGEVRIVIPRPRTHPMLLALGLLPTAIPVIFAPPLAEFFRRSRTPDPVAWMFLGFLILFFGILPAITVVNAFRRSHRGASIVRVSRQGIRIEEKGAWRTRTLAIFDAADILDVDYSTTESAGASARRAAEQKALEMKPSSAQPIGPRMERLLAKLARLAKGRGLTLKTRSGLTTVGEGLEDDEIRWLYAVVRQGLDG